MDHPSASHTAPASHRLLELDFLRFVAVLLVVCRHSETLVESAPSGVRTVLQPLVRGGWIGVDLFFVLSGFLVSGLLFRELDRRGSIDPVRFLTRRAFKILPSFWLYIGFTAAVETIRRHAFPVRRTLVELSFLQNYFPGLAGQTWSLAVEEHFYLLLPAGLILLTAGGSRRERLRWLPGLFAGVAIAALVARGLTSAAHPYTHLTHLYPTHLRIDALFCGVVLGYLSRYREAWLRGLLERWAPLGWVMALAATLPAFFLDVASHPAVVVAGLASNALGFALLIALVLHRGLPRAGWMGTIVRGGAVLGAWSYCTYLWHLEWIGRVTYYAGGHWPFWVVFPACLVGSFALGGIATLLVERPFLRLRDRVFPNRGA